MIAEEFLSKTNFSTLKKRSQDIVQMTIDQVEFLCSKDYYEAKLKGESPLQDKKK